MFGRKKKDEGDLSFRQLWDRERDRAMTPAERAKLEMDRDEKLRDLQNEERRYQIAKGKGRKW